VSIEDKHLKTFPNSCHEIFEDPEWGELFYETIFTWLRQHTSALVNASSGNHIRTQTADIPADDLP
jgi:hypothetical protein